MFEIRPYHRNNNEDYYDPFHEMDEFERHFFDRPFGRHFDRPFDHRFDAPPMPMFKTDIKDEGDKYELYADLPGFEKGDINLDINGDVLTISAERHSEHEEKDQKNKYIRCERSYGSYTRQFNISGVDDEGIKAKYEDGVLKITLPKKTEHEKQGRRLEIE